MLTLDESFSDDPAVTTITGTWKVIAYEDLVARTRILKDNNNSRGMDVVLIFNINQINGKNATNTVFGTFSYLTPREVHIESFGGTKVGEPEWGNLFSRAVYDFKDFEINETYLRFYYNDRKNRVTLQKQ
jgi:hypothetical protein